MSNHSYDAWRGFSGRRGFSHSSAYSPRATYQENEPSVERLMKDLGREVGKIPAPSSEVGKSQSVSIEDFKVVASYSWLDASTPTIVVPGCPPVWRERALPYSVARDIGTVFVDQNAFRLSSSPLLPLIEAVSHHSPDFSFPSVDFVTDRNGLRKLIRWAHGGTNMKTFRIDFELVGTKTVLLQRWEPRPTQEAGPGFEKGFEKASTTAGVGGEEMTGHHRIVTYDFGGFKMLVRFKADACLQSTESKAIKHPGPLDDLDELTTGLEKLSVTPSSDTIKNIPTFNGLSLSIVTLGELVPQSSLVEIKTRSFKNVHTFDWEDTYLQMLLSQTPHLFLCVHQSGRFQEVRKETLEAIESLESARKAQDKLRMLRTILGEIQEIAREEGKGVRLSLICRSGAEMVIYERGGKEGFLPKKTLKKLKLKVETI